MKDTHNFLLKKWKQKELAHFYIMKSPEDISLDAFSFFERWIENFLTSILVEDPIILKTKKQINQIIKNGHPDILFIKPKSKQNKYTWENFNDFFSFLNLKKFELSHRFIFISDIHLISEILCNKLLKSLEEPPSQTTIFFLQTKQIPLLPTISGRAVKIKLSIPQHVKENTSSNSFRRPEESHQYL